MELSKNTWHARNYQAWLRESSTRRARETRYGQRPIELCSYVRIALFWGFLRRFSEAIFGTIIVLLLTSFALAVCYGLGVDIMGIRPLWLGMLVGLGALAAGVAVFFGVVWVIVTIVEWNDRRKHRPLTERREPSVVVEFVKAKKRRICPIIELKD